ncbi:hypothetical protein [Candidatus Spongiihabitans sp.]|uniref:hypothetical protein n=1 Tax=Candidatus Spongiihabitans sp. TaxID=3101308 RepID=UPI003C6EB6C8
MIFLKPRVRNISYRLICLSLVFLSGCSDRFYRPESLFEDQVSPLVNKKEDVNEFIINSEELEKRIKSIDDATENTSKLGEKRIKSIDDATENTNKLGETLINNSCVHPANVGVQCFLRNALLQEIITISDRVCAAHHVSVIASGDALNIGTGVAATLFSAVSMAINPASTKTALTAASTISNSVRSITNEEVYAKAVATTIVKATNTAREKQLAKIDTGMQKKYTEYTVQQGLRDIFNYHNKCSFYFGILEITEALEQRKLTKAEIMGKLQSIENALDVTNRSADEDIKMQQKFLIMLLDTAPD